MMNTRSLINLQASESFQSMLKIVNVLMLYRVDSSFPIVLFIYICIYICMYIYIYIYIYIYKLQALCKVLPVYGSSVQLS